MLSPGSAGGGEAEVGVVAGRGERNAAAAIRRNGWIGIDVRVVTEIHAVVNTAFVELPLWGRRVAEEVVRDEGIRLL